MFHRTHKSSIRKSALKSALLISAAVALTACSGLEDFTQFDPKAGLEKEDYESLISRRGAAQESMDQEPPIPDLQPVIAAPGVPELADTRRVSIAITETTPLRDLFIELARKGGVDLKMDPAIDGGIIYSATDRPFLEVIEGITELAGLRYEFEGNTLNIERDTPYFEYYQVYYPNQTRTASSTASSDVDLNQIVDIGEGGGGGGSNTSAISLSSESQSDFWAELQNNLDRILQSAEADQIRVLGGQEAQIANEEVITEDEGIGVLDVLADPTALVTADEPELEAADTAVDVEQVGGPFIEINRQAGLVTVFGSQRQQVEIAGYLQRVKDATLQQILIEAKIVEVTLEDQYRTGIDWSYVFTDLETDAFGNTTDGNQLNLTTNFTRDIATDSFQDPSLGFVINTQGGNGVRTWDLNSAINLISAFGTVRTLSSPRITVINNQTALLRVSENEVFFELQVEEEQDLLTDTVTLTVDSEIATVPIGLTMGVQPAADFNTGDIALNLRPSITRVTRRVDDPGVALQVASINAANGTNFVVRSLIPIVEVREIDSMVRMQSGQVVVMGGLMQETNQSIREGLPGLSDIPIAGQAFGQRIRETEVSELVIFIKATLVNDRNSVDDYDIDLYQKFAPDPRPIAF